MPFSWKLFRAICIIQMTMAACFAFRSLISVVENFSFGNIARIISFALVMWLAVLAVNLVNNNYPDTPVTGKQKTTYNRLFLANFIFLALLFGFLISEYSVLRFIMRLTSRPFFNLPFQFLITLTGYALTIIFQLIILYGLYELRMQLYANFMKKKFEFEEKPST